MRCCLILLAGFLLMVGGCGGNNTAPVSGQVTLDDKPLARATVVFMPDSQEKNPGPGSVGKTDEQGRFSLQLMTGNVQGAVVGKHKVSITAYEGDNVVPSSSGRDNVFRKPLVPLNYNAETELTFDVTPGGSASVKFDLKSTPTPR